MAAPYPQVPPTWTTLSSVAYLLLAVGRFDGGMTQDHMNVILAKIMEYDRVTSESAKAVLTEAATYEHAWLASEHGFDGWVNSLQATAGVLVKNTPADFRKAVASDMAAIARARGTTSEHTAQAVVEVGRMLQVLPRQR